MKFDIDEKLQEQACALTIMNSTAIAMHQTLIKSENFLLIRNILHLLFAGPFLFHRKEEPSSSLKTSLYFSSYKRQSNCYLKTLAIVQNILHTQKIYINLHQLLMVSPISFQCQHYSQGPGKSQTFLRQ